MKDIQSFKLDSLKEKLLALKRVILLFSGGVDSSFLLYIASISLKKEYILAVIGVSPSLPMRELKEARRFANNLGLRLVEIETEELNNASYAENDGNRCYHCKRELNLTLQRFIEDNRQYADWAIVDGLQASDKVEDRPGYKANAEFSIQHPLYDLGFLKEEIRNYLLQFELEIYDKPQSACLASRIMPGTKVTLDHLEKIDSAENLLLDAGLKNFRVRLHEIPLPQKSSQLLARIELAPSEDPRLFVDLKELTLKLRKVGFDYVTLDLEGYREGGFIKKKHLEII